MKLLSKSSYNISANLTGAIELRERSHRWIGEQLGAALLGEGVVAANECQRFLLVFSLWASSSFGPAGHS